MVKIKKYTKKFHTIKVIKLSEKFEIRTFRSTKKKKALPLFQKQGFKYLTYSAYRLSIILFKVVLGRMTANVADSLGK